MIPFLRKFNEEMIPEALSDVIMPMPIKFHHPKRSLKLISRTLKLINEIPLTFHPPPSKTGKKRESISSPT
jgi:hypothetical protein